jgi:hypothetical protein
MMTIMSTSSCVITVTTKTPENHVRFYSNLQSYSKLAVHVGGGVRSILDS